MWSQSSSSQFTLEVTFVSYENIDNRDSSGECCRRRGCDRCNNRFIFCAQQDQSSSSCDYGISSFDVTSRNDILSFSQTELGNGITNPMRFSPTDLGQWPVSYNSVSNVF